MRSWAVCNAQGLANKLESNNSCREPLVSYTVMADGTSGDRVDRVRASPTDPISPRLSASDRRRIGHSPDRACRAVALLQFDKEHLSAPAAHQISADHLLDAVIGSLHQER